MGYEWIGEVINNGFKTAQGITTTVVDGKNTRAKIEAQATITGKQIDSDTSITNANNRQFGMSFRTLMICICVIVSIAVFGIFVYSYHRR